MKERNSDGPSMLLQRRQVPKASPPVLRSLPRLPALAEEVQGRVQPSDPRLLASQAQGLEWSSSMCTCCVHVAQGAHAMGGEPDVTGLELQT